jgi:hypothetical protein
MNNRALKQFTARVYEYCRRMPGQVSEIFRPFFINESVQRDTWPIIMNDEMEGDLRAIFDIEYLV